MDERRRSESRQDRAVLRSVDKHQRITREQEHEFLYVYQRAVLLALKEAGQLNEAQYQHAEKRLKEQQQEMVLKGRNTSY